MRSFFLALLFLLMLSYWAHLYVTREFDSNNLPTITIENNLPDHGICECRCCLLSGTMCESFLRQSISFKNDFSCDLCTDHFCATNTSEIQPQCQWMYAMTAACFQYEPRRKSFVSVRPFLQ